MANVIFESGTQTQASGLQSGDTLLFETTAPGDVIVTFQPASGFSIATTTLTANGQSLTFNADALLGANLSFFGASGTLDIGGADNDAGLMASGDDASAAWGLDGNDTITIDGAGAHVGHGGAGDDSFALGAGTTDGDYTVYGNDGDDGVAFGAATGNLYVYGGLGEDTLATGAGNDHIYGNVADPSGTVADGADSITAGAGADYVNGNAGDDTIDGGTFSDRLLGGADDDSIIGGAGNDSINGNKGADVIDGGADDDSLRGGADDDSVSGGTGEDLVRGDLGDDTVSGDGGIDLVFGGDGDDVFFFAAGDATSAGVTHDGVTYYDTVGDFTGGDLLDIQGGAFAGEVDYVTGATFTTVAQAQVAAAAALTAGNVVAVAVGGDTYLFYNDTFASTTINEVIKLAGVSDASTITADDFVVA